jgi:hypothetical protein
MCFAFFRNPPMRQFHVTSLIPRDCTAHGHHAPSADAVLPAITYWPETDLRQAPSRPAGRAHARPDQSYR